MTGASVDSSGRPIRLQSLLGKGGQGSVFAVEFLPSLAAKVYHRTPLTAEQVDKLEALAACRSKSLETVAAWPLSVLYTSHAREPCGILIPRIAGSRPLHELYGTSNRRRHFPETQWQHLVLAARNVAAAFDSLHAAGILVGDVNQGNLLVDQEMCVRFIDCDSFQISSHGRTFLCPVGTPHFTPPELQSTTFRDVPRTVEHDHFGLAVLLFHLLFVGRHPFAGRYYGPGELNIEQAIAQGRFAFSRDRSATLVEPPPASLLLDDLPASLGALFEGAFRGPAGARPTAREWVAELDAAIRSRKACAIETTHVYYDRLQECPWCRIEDEGGPEFFGSSGLGAASAERLEYLDEKLRRLTTPSFPALSPQPLTVPQALGATWSSNHRISATDGAAGLLAASLCLSLLAATSVWVFLAGALGAYVGGGWLLLSKEGKYRREAAAGLQRQLQRRQAELCRHVEAVRARHLQRKAAFEKSTAEWQADFEQYRAADTRLQDVLEMHRASEKNRFLTSHLIGEHVADIRGMTFPRASVLQSYGVESAADIDSLSLLGIPMLTPVLTMELMNWRESVERSFVFQPEHGVTLDEMKKDVPTAARRFKVAQARRILLTVRQLESMASAAHEQLASELNQFYQDAAPVRDAAMQLRDFQSSRSGLERALNRSQAMAAGATLAAPAIGCLLRLLFA